MRIRTAVSLAALLLAAVIVPSAQDKAAVQMDKPGPFKPGGPIVFHVKLNEPLPKGAHFDFRISPVSGDEEIPLGSGEAVDASQRVFRVSSTLPEGALPGEWHITVIYLFLPGSGWTHNTIAPNDLKFEVEGKPYPIPTKAEVTVGH
jgi:hypothetical protein